MGAENGTLNQGATEGFRVPAFTKKKQNSAGGLSIVGGILLGVWQFIGRVDVPIGFVDLKYSILIQLDKSPQYAMLCLLGVSRPSFAGFVSHGYLRSESYSIPGSEARAYLNIKGPALYEAVCRRMMAVPQTRSAQHADFDTAENYISAPSVPTDTKVQFRFDTASPSYSGCPQVRSTIANHRKRATRQTSAFS